MIKGIGTDIVQISRIENSVTRQGDSFVQRVLHPDEYALFKVKNTQQMHYLAKRFAAKEALVKALGTGIREGINWVDIQVINDELGKPSFVLHGRVKQLIEEKDITDIQLSLSDEKEYAVAFVVVAT